MTGASAYEVLALAGTVSVASVIGSLHCAGMCGAFVAFATGLGEQRTSRDHAKLQTAYHLGRLTTYTLLGMLAGALGAVLDLGGELIGLQRAAGVLAAVTMLAVGLVGLSRYAGLKLRAPKPAKPLTELFKKLTSVAMKLTPLKRAATIGLLTTLLPCGWLYAFALIAAGTGSPLVGGLVMAAFWLGTVPILASLGAGVRAISGPLAKHAPALMSLVITAVGLYALTGRMTVRIESDGATEPVAYEELIDRTRGFKEDEPHCPLCETSDG